MSTSRLIYHNYIIQLSFLSCAFFFQCKEWGFLLKQLFGQHLGTGDYGHLVVDHSAMLLRHFRSMYKYSGQGFESSHKLHRQLYSKATNHDSSGPGQSCKCGNINWRNLKGFSMDNKNNCSMHILQSDSVSAKYFTMFKFMVFTCGLVELTYCV